MHFALIPLLWLAATLSPTQALEGREKSIRASIPEKGSSLTPAAKHKVEQSATELVDLEGIAKAALKSHWDEQAPAKRQKFMKVFTARFRKAAAEQLDFYRTTSTKFAEEKKVGDDVIVPSTLVVKGEPTQVDYRMRQVRGAWRIEDIIVDEVSTVQDYQSAFARIIKEKGFDGLIARLEKDNLKGGATP